MKNFITGVILVSCALAVFAVRAQAQAIQEGQWSMTMLTKMEGMDEEAAEAMEAMEGMSPEEKAMMQQMMGGMNIAMGPGASGISTSTTTCITGESPVPQTEEEEDCQTTHSVDGNTVNFETVCEDSTSSGQVTYSGDTMEGLIKSSQTVDGEETVTTIEISGQYVGPCDE